MKRSLIPLAIILVMLALPISIGENAATIEKVGQRDAAYDYFGELSSAGDSGAAMSATGFMSRNVDSLQTSVINSYDGPGTHSGALDLTGCLLSGWTLYNVTILANNITAAPERETMGITVNDYIMIRNNTGQVTDALYQAFYNQPHDGRLENYTFRYLAPYYESPLGDAYLGVRSNFSDSQTNTTGWTTPFSQVLTDTSVTHDCSADNAVLNQSTYYYVVIDGTKMTGAYIGEWRFNSIYWRSSMSVLGLQTGYRLRDVDWYTYSGIFRQEAELNYTYTPWNKTTSEPLVYSQPDDVSLSANSTPLTGLIWTFTSDSNITRINFGSSQSVHVKYNLTLWYKKTTEVSTDWFASSSGDDIAWNATTSVSYPAVSESRYLNFTSPSSWTITGLYNSSDPSTNYDKYTVLDKTVKCTQMTNGTWTLTFTAHNHLTEIHLYDSSNNSELSAKCSILVDMDITSRIAEEDNTSVVTSSTNLTIWKGETSIWKPANKSVADGSTTYRWNIDSNTSQNGLYTIEVFWANGTEAGYRITQIVVYYPTQLTAEDNSIDGYTENSFAVRAYFNDTFTPQGLDGTHATLTYSFDGGDNITMFDHSNGTWSALVSTMGKSPGSYQVKLFAEGFALQNRSATINVTLIHETQPLAIQWSDGNDITYVESTDLVVVYRRPNGQNVSDAIVNVTIGSDTWTLSWEPSTETYRTTFSGVDVPPGFGTHGLAIQAWKSGHLEQSDNDQILTLRKEPTNLGISWSNGDSITYVESTVLSVSYTMSNNTPIPGATANVTIGTDTWTLVWNSGTETYNVEFKGSDVPPGFGAHSLSIQAWKKGYQEQIDNSETLTLSKEPTSLAVSWSDENNITYVQRTTLIARYRMSNGTNMPDAMVNVTIGTDLWILTWDAVHEDYRFTFYGSDVPPGFGTHNLNIEAWKAGYQAQSDPSQQLILRLEPTNVAIEWSNSNSITYVEYTVLSVNFTMSNNTPVVGATVNATIGSTTWTLAWNPSTEVYDARFDGDDVSLGLSTHAVTIEAWRFGYRSQLDDTETLTINEEPTSVVIQWSNGNNIGYFEHTFLDAEYRMSNGTSITDATMNVTIGGQARQMIWNITAGTYQVRFDGSDNPPGPGIHSLTIRAWKYGYQDQTDTSATLTLPPVPTSIQMNWTNGDNITYLMSTVLTVNYTMFNGTTVTGATVNATIGSDIWALSWNGVDKTYEVTFNGDDDPPGIGTHAITIRAWAAGFEDVTDSSQTMILREERTSVQVSWSDGSNITYVEHTTLSVGYLMSNSSVIPNAQVNVTIAGTTWSLIWISLDENYQLTFNGTDEPPGFGTHALTVKAWKFGYESTVDTTQDLIIGEEDTTLTIQWSDGDAISYVGGTTATVRYRMSDGIAIIGATVNATIGTDTWILNWNATDESYQVTFSGSDNPPGLGAHALSIKAWKAKYQARTDSSQVLTINEEVTSISLEWSDGTTITYVEHTTLSVNYTMNNGSVIVDAWVNVTNGFTTWPLAWDDIGQVYKIRLNGTDDPPGFGTHGLTIRAWKAGYENRVDSTQTLVIQSELGSIESDWLYSGTITYVEFTVLSINFTMSNGTAIPGATVNATIGSTTWGLVWHAPSETYRIRYNGSDEPPGLGSHDIIVHAWKDGYDPLTDSTKTLVILEEPATITATWLTVRQNNISYFEHTLLSVRYLMSNGTDILGSVVNVTIGVDVWELSWNSTEGAHIIRFNGSDSPPGLGVHTLKIQAWKHGYQGVIDTSQTLIMRPDPTTIHVAWTGGNDISYIEYTTLSVNYRMSNTSEILDASVNATIGLNLWVLNWNATAQAYQVTFYGMDDPPGLGTFALIITASKIFYADQTTNSSLTIRAESTSLVPSWTSYTFNWVESVILSVNYTNSHSTLIGSATQRDVMVNGTLYSMQGTNGTYWIELDNTFDLGYHTVEVTISKHGYDIAFTDLISFDIVIAETTLTLEWSSLVTDYLGQTDLTTNYTYDGTNTPVPGALVTANITIDGVLTITLNQSGNVWTANLTGVFLDLGPHNALVKCWAYGYEYREQASILQVNNVTTDALVVIWQPANVTIEYTSSLNLTVDYTYYGGSVPDSAIVNVTIGGHLYDLVCSAGTWYVSMPCDEIGIGIYDAMISAWDYGYTFRTNITLGVNITFAANSFVVFWEPAVLNITYVNHINVSVVYTSDYQPLLGATVRLSLNGSRIYDLVYDSGDEMWYITLQADEIGLGVWNVTLNANKTGYSDGSDWAILIVGFAEAQLLVEVRSLTIFYDEPSLVNVSYQMANGTIVPGRGGLCTLVIDGTGHALAWQINYWTTSLSGYLLGEGIHHCVITGAAPGYQTVTYEFDITVNLIPTQVLADPSLSVYVTDQVNTSLLYMNTRDSEFLVADDVTVGWPGGYELVRLDNNTYILTLITVGLHNGTFSVQINMSKTGFASVSWQIAVTIYLLPTELRSETDVILYENETLYMSVEFIDTYHATPINSAAVSLIFESTEYHLEYISSQQGYLVELRLGSTISPGVYTLTITARAVDFTDAQITVSLTVLAKDRYTLVVETPTEATEGSTLSVEVTATSNSEPIGGLSIEFHIVTTFASGDQVEWVESGTTNDQGIATIEFDISAGTTELEVWAEFVGSVSEWKAVSEERIVIVRSSGVDPVSILIAIFRNPVTLSLVVGTPSAAILVVLLRKRRIPSKMKVSRSPGPEPPLAPVARTSVFDGFNIIQLPDSVNLVYSMTRKGQLLIVDTVDSLADATEGSSSRVLSQIAYLGSLGLVTSIALSAESKGPLRVLSESAHGEDRLRQEIATSDAGLTRADLSKVLGLSSVKVGSLVRDLLTSDNRFYEVREGRKRFIRFRSGDQISIDL